MTTIATLIALFHNPLVLMALSALFGVLLGVASHFIQTDTKAREAAQDLADLAEEVEPWVYQAETMLMRGDHKYTQVLDKAEKWMLDQGITGQRGRILKKYLPALIEIAVKKVDPKLAIPKKAA